MALRKPRRTASRASRRRWLFSDIPRTVVLLVWFAFGASILFYFGDWFSFREDAAVTPQSRNFTSINKNDNANLYTGSMIIVPSRGDQCWERKLDNRNGKMWDKGYVNCDEAASRIAAENKPEGISVQRLRSIGNAFLGNKD
jgi:hypothetical protein